MARGNVIQFSIEVVDKATKELDKIQDKFSGLGKALLPMAGKIAGAFGAVAVAAYAFVRSMTQTYSAMDDLSKSTGISVQNLSQLQFIADKTHIAMQTLTGSMLAVNDRIQDAARGTGMAADALRLLDVSARDLSELGLEDQLLVIADAFAKIDQKSKRLDIARNLFGGSGSEMLRLLEGGADGIRAYGDELENLGGIMSTSLVEKSSEFQDSLVDVATAFDGLKMAFMDSDFMTSIIDLFTSFNTVLAETISLLNREARPALEQTLHRLTSRLNAQKEMSPLSDEKFFAAPGIIKLQAEIDEVIGKLKAIDGWQSRSLSSGKVTPSVGGGDPKKDGAEAAKKALEGWISTFDTAEQRVQKEMQKFRDAILGGMIPNEEDRVRIFSEINAIFTDGLDEIKVTSKKKAPEIFESMSEAARRASENMHDAFAELFFKPFDEGLRGMLLSFLTVIRRMLAEAAAVKLMSIFGIENFFQSLASGVGTGGTSKAAGGPASGMTLVGERGPELVNLPRGSRVVNNSATKAMTGNSPTFISNIDARGADPGLIARLPQVLEERDRRLMAAVKRFNETGVLPV